MPDSDDLRDRIAKVAARERAGSKIELSDEQREAALKRLEREHLDAIKARRARQRSTWQDLKQAVASGAFIVLFGWFALASLASLPGRCSGGYDSGEYRQR